MLSSIENVGLRRIGKRRLRKQMYGRRESFVLSTQRDAISRKPVDGPFRAGKRRSRLDVRQLRDVRAALASSDVGLALGLGRWVS